VPNTVAESSWKLTRIRRVPRNSRRSEGVSLLFLLLLLLLLEEHAGWNVGVDTWDEIEERVVVGRGI
jgi:hypothetical protein